MKNNYFVLIFLCALSNSFSQDYDLVITTKGDSIVCKIDSITDPIIYLKMKHNNKWIHTSINNNEVVEFKYNAIDKKQVVFKPGTSYIAAYNERYANLAKALKLNKTGKTLTTIGACAIVFGPLFTLATAQGDALGWTGLIIGSIVFFTGVGMEIVGIPMRIINSKRIKRINNSAYNHIKIDLIPGIQPSYITENCQPGLTIRISF